jgi:hypothetical protein
MDIRKWGFNGNVEQINRGDSEEIAVDRDKTNSRQISRDATQSDRRANIQCRHTIVLKRAFKMTPVSESRAQNCHELAILQALSLGRRYPSHHTGKHFHKSTCTGILKIATCNFNHMHTRQDGR